MMYFIVALWLV